MTLGHQAEHLQNLTLDAFFANLHSYGIEPVDSGHTQGELFGIKLTSEFQPIVHLGDERVVGHEALLRPRYAEGGALSTAQAFAIAERYGELIGFDRACRTVHMLNYIAAAPAASSLLSLNVHPKLLTGVRATHGAAFERILHYYSVPTQRVILEIPVQPFNDDKWLAGVIDNYRYHGYHVAVDLGLNAEAVLNCWRSFPDFVILADYVKFGVGVIRAAGRDLRFGQRLRELIDFGHAHGVQIVAVGIEKAAELDVAVDVGIDLGQGSLFGRPAEQPLFVALPRLRVVTDGVAQSE